MHYFSYNSSLDDICNSVLNVSLYGSLDSLNYRTEGKLRYKVAKTLGRRKEIHANYPIGFLYWGISEYLKVKDSKSDLNGLINNLIMYFDSNDQLNYDIEVVDQVPIGCCFINLYLLTSNIKYKVAADKIAAYLLKRFNEDRILYRSQQSVQLVDTLGMVVPFLCMYSELVGDVQFRNIASTVFKDFESVAVLSNKIPAHGFHIHTNCLLGSSNWGRGLGWYLLAKGYLHDMELDMFNLLSKISYVQFPFQDYSMKDSSVALLCEYYKVLADNTYVPQYGSLYSYIRSNGLIDFCSGDTIGFNQYASHYGLGGLSNGLFLLLLSKCKTL